MEKGRASQLGLMFSREIRNRSATLWYNGVDAYYAGNSSCLGCPMQLYGNGRITITEINEKSIKGTFEFNSAVNGATMLSKMVIKVNLYQKKLIDAIGIFIKLSVMKKTIILIVVQVSLVKRIILSLFKAILSSDLITYKYNVMHILVPVICL